MKAGKLAAWLALLPLGCATGEAPPPEPGIRLLADLGDHHFAITTRSAQAQRYFDQGLVLTYGFNHEAAVRSFREAARLDPGCAMCFWGVGYALGPNINAPMGPGAAAEALEAVRQARSLAAASTPRERAYIEALAVRYSDAPEAGRPALDRAFSIAMRDVRTRHPDDPDAQVLAAESLMDLSPWDYWLDPETPRPNAAEALGLLEAVLAADPTHPGANHYYIHAVETYHPERAVPAAERLADLAPDAGHLVHMPSHIFWRVGRYEDALEINRRAAATDEAFFAWCGRTPFYRALYYPHNVHFLWAAAMAEGRADLALMTARRLVAAVPDEVLVEFPPAEEWRAMPLFTLLRFGRWDAVLGEPAPPPQQRYATAIWHYARGLALARLGRSNEAEGERRQLAAAADDPQLAALEFVSEPSTRYLRLALDHLDGEIAAEERDWEGAIAALEAAVALDDSFQYTEPPRWWFPPRQALGAVLLAAGRPAEAEAVYLRDLADHPRNGWSLYGLAESLDAQGRRTEAAAAATGFGHAWARSDVEIRASRF